MALVGDKKKKKHGQNTENGVVITVYVESSRVRSSKKIKPQCESKTRRGCDRKAQLLAYSRHLRNIEASQNIQVQSQPKFKKRLWFVKPVRISSPSKQMSQSLRTFLEHKGSTKRKCRGNKCCYLFLMKLKSMFKKLSCKEIKW